MCSRIRKSSIPALTLGLMLPLFAAGCNTEPLIASNDEQDKIADAMSAAPASLAANATIVDWPEAAGGEMTVLRDGTNGWVCHPTMPPGVGPVAGGDMPMCLDPVWQSWAGAWVTKGTPQIGGAGIAYMLQGDHGASNTDPYATGPTADNEWVQTGPHIMVLVPDPAQLETIPTDPNTGGPFVMWKGTPYAHIMIPTGPHDEP